MPAFNLHSLLDSAVYATTYLDRLTLSSVERDEMQSARTEIRDRLRSRLPGMLHKALGSEQTGAQAAFLYPRLVGLQDLEFPLRGSPASGSRRWSLSPI